MGNSAWRLGKRWAKQAETREEGFRHSHKTGDKNSHRDSVTPRLTGGIANFDGPYLFDESALNGNTLYLAQHQFETGQPVVYRTRGTAGESSPIGGLSDNSVYYVKRV